MESISEPKQTLEKRFKFSCRYGSNPNNYQDKLELSSAIEHRICDDEKECRQISESKY